jgi:hypothetical protein
MISSSINSYTTARNLDEREPIDPTTVIGLWNGKVKEEARVGKKVVRRKVSTRPGRTELMRAVLSFYLSICAYREANAFRRELILTGIFFPKSQTASCIVPVSVYAYLAEGP